MSTIKIVIKQAFDTIEELAPRAARGVSDKSNELGDKAREVKQLVDAKDREIASRHASGDRNLPGNHPPSTPAASWDPATGTPGWEHVNRGPVRDTEWAQYERQIAGTQPVNGRNPEYVAVNPETGRPVRYDGHTLRGDPPVEVFLEAKKGYEGLHWNPDSTRSQGMRESIVAQIERQRAALPDGAQLEWHVSSIKGAEAIQRIFDDLDIFDVPVHYTPKV